MFRKFSFQLLYIHLTGVTGKYYKDGAEQTSSEESLKEDLQGQVYELSAKYCHLEGYEPLDAPEPPPQEAPKVKSPKKKSKKDKKVEESAGPSGDAPETDGAGLSHSQFVSDYYLLSPLSVILIILRYLPLAVLSEYICVH